MALQQGGAGTGYRDPMKAMTIKALQDRQKAAAIATAKSMEAPATIASPWQGLSHLTGVLGAEYTQGKADSAEADARNRLAALKAQINPDTGATQQQIADMSVLDPEFADKEYNRAMEERASVRNREDMQQAAADLQTSQQTFTGGQNDLNRQADAARQKLADANAAGRQDDAQAATVDLARINADIDKKKATEAEQAKVDAIGTGTEARKAEWLKLNPTGDIDSPEAQAYILRDAAEPTGGFGGPAGIKAMQDFQHEGNILTTSLNDINEAKALVPKALTGTIGRIIADKASDFGETGIGLAGWLSKNVPGLASVAPEYANISRDQIQATVRLYQIMDNVATMRMSGALKGQTSNLEMEKFTKIFANPGSTPEMKMQALLSMEQAFKMDRDSVSSTIRSAGGQELTPYEYKPVTDTTAAAPAPDAAAGGAGGGAGGDPLAEARAAIAKGADKAKVIARLKEKGIDATGL